jgi:phytoene dehydrogenase-like protein
MTSSSVDCDVLVVGGGMAGLTAAAYLSRAGLKVRLCEKEKKIGGLVNSFEYKGFVFDGGIRATESTGIVLPMLRQLGINVEFLPNPVSLGIGSDVLRISSRDSLAAYRELLVKHFPENGEDIAAILREIDRVMGYLDVLYGIDNPLFLDLKSNPRYVLSTILPWALKYLLTAPKIARLNRPVEEHLARFTRNQALIDIIAQHFFQKTPAFFALSYFTLYLDYRYPRGGTGALAQALDRFARERGAQVSTETEIVSVEPGAHRAKDVKGNVWQYRKLVWAADLKALYRLVNPDSVADATAAGKIKARQQELSDKTGGDSVFTLYITANMDKSYFAGIASGHFFYTPSAAGLSHVRLDELIDREPGSPTRFTGDKARVFAWLKRFVKLNTFEISIPVLRDKSLAPAGKTGLIVSLLFDYSLTKHIRATGWYDEFRQLMADCFVEVLDASIYPGLKQAVIDRFTSTPLTIERVAGTSDGAITGWAFTNDSIPAENRQPRIAGSVLTPIPDVYQAGQWTYSPSGLPIAILTGKLAADRVSKDLA